MNIVNDENIIESLNKFSYRWKSGVNMGSVIGVIVIVLCILNIVIEYIRLKAIRDNTRVYKEMRNKLTEAQVRIDFYMKKDKAITIGEVAEEVVKKLKKANSKIL